MLVSVHPDYEGCGPSLPRLDLCTVVEFLSGVVPSWIALHGQEPVETKVLAVNHNILFQLTYDVLRFDLLDELIILWTVDVRAK